MLMSLLCRGGSHISRSISDSETLHEPAEEGAGSHSLRMASPKLETLDIKQSGSDAARNPEVKGGSTAGAESEPAHPSRPAANGEKGLADQDDDHEGSKDENRHPNLQVRHSVNSLVTNIRRCNESHVTKLCDT